MKQDETPFLELIQEIKIGVLLNEAGKNSYEASGVVLKDGSLHIVFDDTPCLLRPMLDWRHPEDEPGLLELAGSGGGYEDITYQESTNRWYCLIEAAERKSGVFMPRVDVFDDSFAFLGSSWLPFPLKAGNKGFEGLTTLHAAGNEYLLGLCEGNGCKSGSAGAQPGKGRIQVFTAAGDTWEHAGTIKLPKSVRFRDYASLDVRNGFMSVISQASSALWIGRLCGDPAGLDNLFDDEGRLFLFPRDKKGRTLYCNVEGVAWLSPDRVVVVSDKAKGNQAKRCARTDQSIHIFKLPDEGLYTVW